jgi:hypothetical protein
MRESYPRFYTHRAFISGLHQVEISAYEEERHVRYSSPITILPYQSVNLDFEYNRNSGIAVEYDVVSIYLMDVLDYNLSLCLARFDFIASIARDEIELNEIDSEFGETDMESIKRNETFILNIVK